MRKFRDYEIQFIGLKNGDHNFEYTIDNTFFEKFEYTDFIKSSLKVKLSFLKKTTLFELDFSFEGRVTVPCDATGDVFDLPLKGKLPLLVKFGELYNDDDDEVLIIPHKEFQINIAQYIYEMVVLSLPLRKVKEGVAFSNDAYLEIEQEEKKEIEKIDPRWEKLKTLLQ